MAKTLLMLLNPPLGLFSRPHSQSIMPLASCKMSKSSDLIPENLSQSSSSSSSVSMKIEDPNTSNFPTPISPPLPQISKDIELSRALTASSKSSLFSISTSHILFQDHSLVAVNKPCGIYCETILSSLLSNSHFINDKTQPLELHLANRLDRDTSGVMIITKSHKVAAKLVKAFTDHKVKKTYIALCVGAAPKWEKISLQSGHGRSKYGAWRVYSATDIGRSLPGGSIVREMATSFEVLSINGQGSFREPNRSLAYDMEPLVIEEQRSKFEVSDEKKDEILIRAYPKSGRTHQIRLHCQYLGIPIRGDVKYEGVHEWRGTAYDTHALHAESLLFDHPVSGSPIQFYAPLPLWASEALEATTRLKMT